MEVARRTDHAHLHSLLHPSRPLPAAEVVDTGHTVVEEHLAFIGVVVNV